MVSPGRLEINGGVLSLALVLHLVGAASVLGHQAPSCGHQSGTLPAHAESGG